jgi:hypothetical protein
MKAQATMELLLFFVVLLAVIGVLIAPLMDAYSAASKKNEVALMRSALNDDIMAQQIKCNSDVSVPKQAMPNPNLLRRISNWRIELVANNSNTLPPFVGIFKGCEHGGWKSA